MKRIYNLFDIVVFSNLVFDMTKKLKLVESSPNGTIELYIRFLTKEGGTFGDDLQKFAEI